MYKKGLTFVLAMLLMMSFVFALDSTSSSDAVNKAYSCLQDQISKKSAYTLQEATFGVLALGNVKNLTDTITSQESNQACWPKSGCTIKDTSQVLLAYNRIGQSTTDIENWLLTKNSTSSDLAWYLEMDIENHVPASCTIKYDSGQATISIDSNMKLSGSAGSCFSISSSGYLLKVRDSCLSKTFDISCNQGFISTMLYQKNKGENVDCLDQGSVTCYVLGETHGAPSLGTTQESITSSCFKSGNNCDYEGTLWATLALQQAGKNIDSFVPYLMALADDYQRFFSYAFLSSILGGDDEYSYSKVLELRTQNQYWELPSSPSNRYYDTAIGMLALGSGVQDELAKTQDYLLNIQTKEGCWNNNNIKDTAFLLYSGWKRSSVPSGGTPSTGSTPYCSSAGFFCEKLSDCISVGGIQEQAYTCTGVSVCCSKQVIKPTCASQSGHICSAQTQCDSQTFEASDTQGCCLGTCTPVQVTSDTCTAAGGVCQSSCSSGQTTTLDTCSSSSDYCCVSSKSGISTGLIILLIILIILIVLAILFRHRLQMWWFSRKSGSDTTSKPVSRPGAPVQSYPQRPMMPRPFTPQSRPAPRPAPRPVQRPSPSTKSSPSKEYDETLKKLRDMSK